MADDADEDVDSKNDDEDDDSDDADDAADDKSGDDAGKKDDDSDSKNDDTQDDDSDDSADDSDDDADDVEALKAKNKKLFARAKKAEGFVIKDGKWVKKETPAKPKPESDQDQGDLTSRDVLALTNAKVTVEEDINEVVEYAKFKKISVAKALGTTYIQDTLKKRSEERATAEATNTGGGRRGSSRANTDQILSDANKGKVPSNPDDLAAARDKARRAKIKK